MGQPCQRVEGQTLQMIKHSAGAAFSGRDAIAKMRLFQAFDEIEGLAAPAPSLFVDDSNLATLLSRLDL
jgi:hypothetical protein